MELTQDLIAYIDLTVPSSDVLLFCLRILNLDISDLDECYTGIPVREVYWKLLSDQVREQCLNTTKLKTIFYSAIQQEYMHISALPLFENTGKKSTCVFSRRGWKHEYTL